MSKSKLKQTDFKNLLHTKLDALQKSGNMNYEKCIEAMAMLRVGDKASKAEVLAEKEIVQALLGESSPFHADGIKKLSTEINQKLQQVNALNNEAGQNLDNSKPVNPALNDESPKTNPLKPK